MQNTRSSGANMERPTNRNRSNFAKRKTMDNAIQLLQLFEALMPLIRSTNRSFNRDMLSKLETFLGKSRASFVSFRFNTDSMLHQPRVDICIPLSSTSGIFGPVSFPLSALYGYALTLSKACTVPGDDETSTIRDQYDA